MDFQRADTGLFRDLADRVLGEAVLKAGRSRKAELSSNMRSSFESESGSSILHSVISRQQWGNSAARDRCADCAGYSPLGFQRITKHKGNVRCATSASTLLPKLILTMDSPATISVCSPPALPCPGER